MLSLFKITGIISLMGRIGGQNRSGKVTRQFSADLNGTWDGKQLILKEKFNWDEGEVQDREWTINKIDENNYEGTAGDVVGKAKGVALHLVHGEGRPLEEAAADRPHQSMAPSIGEAEAPFREERLPVGLAARLVIRQADRVL